MLACGVWVSWVVVLIRRQESCHKAMASTQTLHMVSGDGRTSYARNSGLQSSEQTNMKPMIEEAIASVLRATPLPGSIGIADLGCSSGPNALALTSMAIDAVHRHCLQKQQQPPELCIHLNDLPNNDFNLVVKTIAAYRQSKESSGTTALASIVPGSFHGRLFSKCSLHLVCSTCSLHWLSKAPEDLVRNSIPVYDGDEAVWQARRAIVLEAYVQQFEKDFTRLLGLRAQELVPGGRMVFSMLGRRSDDAAYKSLQHQEFIARVLHEMASTGLIDREKVDSFYVPVHVPSEKELREIIEAEGSFSIDKMAVHGPSIAVGRGATRNMRAYSMRAVIEPMILQHFGSSTQIMDEFVKTAERRMNTIPQDEYPCKPLDFLAVSLTRI